MMIKGSGVLEVKGKILGPAEYEIVISEGRGLKSAGGTIFAPFELLMEAFEAGDVVLIRDDSGYRMKIILSDLSGLAEEAAIVVSGSPGPLK